MAWYEVTLGSGRLSRREESAHSGPGTQRIFLHWTDARPVSEDGQTHPEL